MQIFILHYYRAIPLIRCLRIYTKNDNNMATVGFYLDTRREKKDGTFPVSAIATMYSSILKFKIGRAHV